MGSHAMQLSKRSERHACTEAHKCGALLSKPQSTSSDQMRTLTTWNRNWPETINTFTKFFLRQHAATPLRDTKQKVFHGRRTFPLHTHTETQTHILPTLFLTFPQLALLENHVWNDELFLSPSPSFSSLFFLSFSHPSSFFSLRFPAPLPFSSCFFAMRHLPHHPPGSTVLPQRPMNKMKVWILGTGKSNTSLATCPMTEHLRREPFDETKRKKR